MLWPRRSTRTVARNLWELWRKSLRLQAPRRSDPALCTGPRARCCAISGARRRIFVRGVLDLGDRGADFATGLPPEEEGLGGIRRDFEGQLNRETSMKSGYP
jgi:hypothetical protein